MKRYLYILTGILCVCSCTDLSEYESDIDNIKGQIEQLKKDCAKINDRIVSMQALAAQIKARESITGVSELLDQSGKVTGYVITFKNADTITINLPEEDDAPSVDAPTEVLISIKEDAEGLWWTLNGEYMLDGEGERLPASLGGQTPLLKIENDVWLVSVDGGKTWESMADGNVWEPGAVGTENLWREI